MFWHNDAVTKNETNWDNLL